MKKQIYQTKSNDVTIIFIQFNNNKKNGKI